MERFAFKRAATRQALAGAVALVAIMAAPAKGKADEGGVGFWLPGLYGSLAATPLAPGWSESVLYLHSSLSASGQVGRARAITIGRFNPTLNLNIAASVQATLDAGAVFLTYVPATPVLGGQASFGLGGIYGRSSATLDATIFGTLGPIPFSQSFSINDARDAFGDLFPQFALRWNQGVNNWMVYLTGDIPVGAYDPSRLANLGIGHGAIDGGGGYTYFDPKTGNEFSAVLGFTYNFENTHTQYQNGVDMHLDWGTSKFVTKELQLGFVGYAYRQVGCDSGAGAKLGCFQVQVFGIGPQIGYIIPMGDLQGYVNVKGYKEFWAENRASGWNAWLTFAISPAAATASAQPKKPMFIK